MDKDRGQDNASSHIYLHRAAKSCTHAAAGLPIGRGCPAGRVIGSIIFVVAAAFSLSNPKPLLMVNGR